MKGFSFAAVFFLKMEPKFLVFLEPDFLIGRFQDAIQDLPCAVGRHIVNHDDFHRRNLAGVYCSDYTA